MLNWFKKKELTGYKQKLLNAFPKALKADVLTVIDVIPFCTCKTKDIRRPFYWIIIVCKRLIGKLAFTINLNNELLTIPNRVHFNEPSSRQESKLTDIQKTILNCIYLKHDNGYVRQRRLEQRAENNEYWTTPYKLSLLGEYIVEIIQVLDKQITDKSIDNYKRLIKENPKYWEQTESRIISYWNEYYRRQYPKLTGYLGYQIANRIKTE